MAQDQLARPKLIRSSAIQHPEASMHQLDALCEFDFALQYEVLTINELMKILGTTRPVATQFYTHYLSMKNILSALYSFFNRNQLQQVLSNILNFY